MSNAKIRGIVHVIEETKTFGQKGFRKRTVVLEQQNGRFANYIPLEFTNDGCDLVDDLRLGDEVDITYRLGGRKWQKDPSSEVKYFLALRRWRLPRSDPKARTPSMSTTSTTSSRNPAPTTMRRFRKAA